MVKGAKVGTLVHACGGKIGLGEHRLWATTHLGSCWETTVVNVIIIEASNITRRWLVKFDFKEHYVTVNMTANALTAGHFNLDVGGGAAAAAADAGPDSDLEDAVDAEIDEALEDARAADEEVDDDDDDDDDGDGVVHLQDQKGTWSFDWKKTQEVREDEVDAFLAYSRFEGEDAAKMTNGEFTEMLALQLIRNKFPGHELYAEVRRGARASSAAYAHTPVAAVREVAAATPEVLAGARHDLRSVRAWKSDSPSKPNGKASAAGGGKKSHTLTCVVCRSQACYVCIDCSNGGPVAPVCGTGSARGSECFCEHVIDISAAASKYQSLVLEMHINKPGSSVPYIMQCNYFKIRRVVYARITVSRYLEVGTPRFAYLAYSRVGEKTNAYSHLSTPGFSSSTQCR